MRAECLTCGGRFTTYEAAREHYWDMVTARTPHGAWALPRLWLIGRPMSGPDTVFGGLARDHDQRKHADYLAGLPLWRGGR